MRVTICICTFKRRELLRALLDGIDKLVFRKVAAPQLRVLVVDNDALGTAQAVCTHSSVRWPVKYVIEPRRGISFARNRAIAEAGDVDYVATIDDDEIPAAEWLDELLWTQAQFGADIVNGPVMPKFNSRVSEWVKRGGFFRSASHTTGTEIAFCYTGNSLIRAAVFAVVPRFEDEFALTGAEDTHFFLRVRRSGFKIVWSEDAIAYEEISTARANAAWIFRREFQIGNSWTHCEASLDRRIQTRLIRFAKACCFVMMGTTWALTSIVFGKAAVVRSLRPAYRGVGMLAALAGSRFRAYQTAGSEPVEPGFSGAVSGTLERDVW